MRSCLVEPRTSQLSIRRQCELLSINRSNVYYKPVPEKPENLEMMNIMDRHLTKHPIEGVKSMVYLLIVIGNYNYTVFGNQEYIEIGNN